MTTTVLFDASKWIVLTRAPFAYGPFEDCHAAYEFDARHGGVGSIVTTWHQPEWVTMHFPPDYGAVWVNGDWDNPVVVGAFYDIADAVQTSGGVDGTGMAVELDEFPEESV